MSNLGMKITGAEMEVGFLASTREEFDSFLDRLRLMADTVWPAEAAAAPPQDPESQFEVDYLAAREAKFRRIKQEDIAKWREEQGLR